jgi:Insertion element 4 transposase N-terminal
MARSQQQAGALLADRIAVGALTRAFPPHLVDRVVDQSGVREQRRRALPARLVVYYLLAMILFFRSGYDEVWAKLTAGLTWALPLAPGPRGMPPTPAAITYARKRLGWQVMATLLEETADLRAGEEEPRRLRISGMRLVTLDEARLSLPDTPENASVFGRPRDGPGSGSFPQVRVVALGECGTSAILSAAVSGAAADAAPLIRKVLGKLAPGDLLSADSRLCPSPLLAEVVTAGVHVLWRARPAEYLPRLAAFPDGTYASRLTGPAAPASGIAVRVISYSREGQQATPDSRDFVLVTDVLDVEVLPAQAAIAAYESRWRLGACFSALDISLPGRSPVVVRSKNPDLIHQEVHAMLCCYQAIRGLIRPEPPRPVPGYFALT